MGVTTLHTVKHFSSPMVHPTCLYPSTTDCIDVETQTVAGRLNYIEEGLKRNLLTYYLVCQVSPQHSCTWLVPPDVAEDFWNKTLWRFIKDEVEQLCCTERSLLTFGQRLYCEMKACGKAERDDNWTNIVD